MQIITHFTFTSQDILAEIVSKKPTLDHVRAKGEAVAQRSTDPRLSNNMMQLATRYQALASASKVCDFWLSSRYSMYQ